MGQTETLTRAQGRFLACFGACGNVLRAARWSKVGRASHYRWLDESPEYAAAYAKAELEAARTLEDEAVRRAHEGVRKAIRYKGKIVGYDTEYSDSLLMFCLKGLLPEKYRDRVDNRLSNPDGSLIAAIDAMLANDRANKDTGD